MNDTFFKNIHISNFKSLKDVTLSDCKRINLLIGKPNVGKSNILEAIGLFSLPYIKYNKSQKLSQFIRFEHISELFFDADTEKNIKVNSDDDFCSIEYSDAINCVGEPVVPLIDIYIDLSNNFSYSIGLDEKLNLYFPNLKKLGDNIRYGSSRVKLYKYQNTSSLSKNKKNSHSYLIPPFGVNLLEAIQDSKIDKELSKLFTEYGLNLLLDKTNNTLRIMKTLKEDNAMVSFPYSSIADTLQRVIFFKTAIASNKNSILLFEEPEAHCFPPYIAHFTRDVIYSETNQFFIATHSPYVLNDFLEYKREDLAIFMADFKDGQTVINRLTDDEVDEVYEYGIDVFFNYERFTR